MIIRILIFLSLVSSAWAEKSVHVYVCLCDNENQGIMPVSAKIGDGMDPENNLYWGCSDGLAKYFVRSKRWILKSKKKAKDDKESILRSLVFRHQSSPVTLTAHAYRGDKMEECLEAFLTKCREAGKGELVVYMGHNGLMDTSPEIPKAASKDDVAAETIV